MDLSLLQRLLAQFLRPGVPKYVAFRDAIVHSVTHGLVPPGARLPTEEALASALPLSLGTIQRGLRQLVAERIVTRRVGQGSFIVDRPSESMDQPFHCRFVDDTKQGYLPIFPSIVAIHANAGPGPWRAFLRSDTLLQIDRRISVGNEFDIYNCFFADRERLPEFLLSTKSTLQSSNFKNIIFRACGRAPGRVDVLVRMQAPPISIRDALELKKNVHCLVVRAHAFLGDIDPIYYQEIWIPPNSRELHIVTDARSSDGLRMLT
jgi:DNA-binding GntR family transcriptional regulator